MPIIFRIDGEKLCLFVNYKCIILRKIIVRSQFLQNSQRHFRLTLLFCPGLLYLTPFIPNQYLVKNLPLILRAQDGAVTNNTTLAEQFAQSAQKNKLFEKTFQLSS